MTDQNTLHRAREAKRLLNEPLLLEAFEVVRFDALKALEVADLSKPLEAVRLQAKAQVIEEIRDALSAVITAGGGLDGGVAEGDGQPAE